MKESKQTNVKVRVLSHREFGNVKVVNDGEYNGYACLDDLCAILNLSKKQVKEKLDGHLYTVSPKEPSEKFHDMDFVDEFGIYCASAFPASLAVSTTATIARLSSSTAMSAT